MKAFRLSLVRKKFMTQPINSIFQVPIYKSFSTANDVKQQLSKEQQWQNLYLEKIKNQEDILQKELNENERNEVRTLVDLVMKLSKDEMFYYALLTNRRANLITEGKEPTFTSNFQMQNTWPPGKENWLKTPNSISTFDSFSGGSGGIIFFNLRCGSKCFK
jgi:hypothetical protein